jgi:hypothetical protein
MGTRADFYVGRGEQAEWLGSIAWDGYPDGISLTSAERETRFGISTAKHYDWPNGEHLFDAATELEFRERVRQFFANREDITLPEQGWPWPWETSHTTDYSYAFDAGTVYACCFGHRWYRANDPALNEDETEGKEAVFPDMTARQNVTFGKRSGVMVLGVPK